jgi:hypothetical protein
VFLVTCFKYYSRGLPTAFFPDIAHSRMLATNSLCLIIYHIHKWRQFFKIFKTILSSFALWKTSFVILYVHFIFNILLHHHISNAFTPLSSLFPWVHISKPKLFEQNCCFLSLNITNFFN